METFDPNDERAGAWSGDDAGRPWGVSLAVRPFRGRPLDPVTAEHGRRFA